MRDSGYARLTGLLGGIAAAGLVLAGGAMLAALARPYLWLEILIFLWVMPLAVVGFGCAGPIAEILSEKLFAGQSTWKWTVPSQGRQSGQHFW
jgi:hypothetical protein